MREASRIFMNITPLIPDGYNGPIKQLTCRICKHVFYITQQDYQRSPQISFCHECSLILREELEKTQGASPLTPPPVREKPVARAPLPSSVASIQPIPLLSRHIIRLFGSTRILPASINRKLTL